MTDDATVSNTNSGVTRRRLVKTGAHAAWVVPTVVVVAAAPAMANSVRSKLSVGNPRSVNRSGQDVTVTGQITNEPGIDATGVTVTVLFGRTGVTFTSSNANFGTPVRTQQASSTTFVFTLAANSGTIAAGGVGVAFSAVFATGSTTTTSVTGTPAATNDNGTSTGISVNV